jgi:hypothetical protein
MHDECVIKMDTIVERKVWTSLAGQVQQELTRKVWTSLAGQVQQELTSKRHDGC